MMPQKLISMLLHATVVDSFGSKVGTGLGKRLLQNPAKKNR